MIYSFLFLAFGFLVSILCTPWAIRFGLAGIGLDHADEPRKNHGAPIPRLGGLPLMLAMTLSVVLILAFQREASAHWFATLLGSAMMYGLGLWDDLRRLGARVKLLGQVA